MGIGGKIDATNIVTEKSVVCTAITSLGLDHCDVIGDTLEHIAREKSGIIKPGVPIVLGPTCIP